MPETTRRTSHLCGRLTLFSGLLLGIAASAFSQTRTWFDINPSQSNDGNNGASGGRINHVGAASDSSKVYAATEWGGLYQSFDQGNPCLHPWPHGTSTWIPTTTKRCTPRRSSTAE